MSNSRPLRNLLKLRKLETEQRRVVLDSAMSELQTLERALDATRKRERAARHGAVGNAADDALERRAFELQQRIEERRHKLLQTHCASAAQRADDARLAFRQKRMEQRQAESLVDAVESRELRDLERRLQRAIDDWHASRSRMPSSKTP